MSSEKRQLPGNQIMANDFKRVVYDRDADVLYISTQPGRHGIVQESLPGVLWRHESGSGDIVGVTIMDFVSHWKARMDDLVHDLEGHLRIDSVEAKSLLERDLI